MTPSYLIVEPQFLVAEDLFEILKGFSPDAVVVQVASIAEAIVACAAIERLTLVFLGVELAGSRDTAFLEMLQRKRATLVRFGGAAEGPDEMTVDAPFTESDMRQFLSAWFDRRPMCG